MDRSERHIEKYLKHLGYANVVHHPDGERQPPDFSVNGRIAVEVRRLNQNIQTDNGTRGLESDFATLARLVPKVLASFGPPGEDGSWFVCYSFRRPLLQPWRAFERELRQSLLDLRAQGMQNGAAVDVMPRFRIRIYRAEQSFPTLFVWGGCSDGDSGGFVLGEIVRNLGICVAEKTRKVDRVQANYPEWWLALVDYIGYGRLEAFEQDQLRAVFDVEGPWQKIFLVDPDDPTRAVTL